MFLFRFFAFKSALHMQSVRTAPCHAMTIAFVPCADAFLAIFCSCLQAGGYLLARSIAQAGLKRSADTGKKVLHKFVQYVVLLFQNPTTITT